MFLKCSSTALMEWWRPNVEGVPRVRRGLWKMRGSRNGWAFAAAAADGSAGARMAAWLGSRGTGAFGEKSCLRPAAVVMQYTGLSEVTGDEPPTYSCVGTDDEIASYRTMQERTSRIRAQGTDAEIEVFDGLPHGFGLGEGTVAEGWLDRAAAFWERQMR